MSDSDYQIAAPELAWRAALPWARTSHHRFPARSAPLVPPVIRFVPLWLRAGAPHAVATRPVATSQL